MKHSPGPWEDNFGDICSGDRCVTRKDWRYSEDDPQWQADARLIQSAPRMVELLRHLAGGPRNIRDLQDEARALLDELDG